MPLRAGQWVGNGRAPRLAAGLLLAMCLAAAGQGNGDFAQRLDAALDAAAAEPQRGLSALRTLREQVLAEGRLDARLAVDEAECRVLADIDAGQARSVADAGLRAARSTDAPPPGAARTPWLRLRVCRAAQSIELGDIAGGRAEIESLLAQTLSPKDAVPYALARLERGVHRSRSGDYDDGQQDLIAACDTLQLEGPPRDRDLCLGQLANHYRRIGDGEEALRLLVPLRDAARRSGAVYDDSIHTFGIAQAQHMLQRWDDAITAFEQAAATSEQLHDRPGIAYAQHGIAGSLLKLQRPADALRHAELALAHLDPAADPRQFENITVTLAEAQAALGRGALALARLDSIEPALRQRNEASLLVQALTARAQALRSLGRWQEAFVALDAARVIEDRLQTQRLSQQSARLRMQFNRTRDARELAALRQLNDQGQRLRQTQAVALALAALLLAALLFFAWRKFRQARQLQSLVSTDELTGLPNRRALFAYAEQALERARVDRAPLSVLMIDVDHFKRINDSHGHAVGDEVLRHVARMLAGGLRGRDRLGRIGGEEFLAVLPGAGADAARQVAERMRSAIGTTPPSTSAGTVAVTVSIGVADARAGEAAGAMIARADAALYRAKNAGRDAVAVHAEQPAEAG